MTNKIPDLTEVVDSRIKIAPVNIMPIIVIFLLCCGVSSTWSMPEPPRKDKSVVEPATQSLLVQAIEALVVTPSIPEIVEVKDTNSEIPDVTENVKLDDIKANHSEIPDKSDIEMSEKINQFINSYGGPLKNLDTGGLWVQYGRQFNVHPYLGVAIAKADSSLGKHLTTSYNLGNVGNTDSCPRCNPMQSWDQSIKSIFQTLKNLYLGKATKVCHLSRGGWRFCPEAQKQMQGKFYASSVLNWHKNVILVYSKLLGETSRNDLPINLT